MSNAHARVFPLLATAMLLMAVFGVSQAMAGLNESSGTSTEASRFGLVDAGEYYTCGVNEGDIFCWGRPSWNIIGVPTQVTVSGAPFRPGTIRDLSVGGSFWQGTACAVVDNGASVGEVWCWGANTFGQFGNNTIDATTNEYNEPVRAFGSLTGATRVTVGGNHVCVLLTGGTVRCAGDNSAGELGNGSTTLSKTPVTVGTGSGNLASVISISAGGATSCAVDQSGATWCWGDSSSYQGGRVSTINSSVAQTVYDNGGSTSVVVSGPAVCTLGSYGANCWGTNASPPNLTSQNTPRLGTGETGLTVLVSSPVNVINFAPTAIITTATHSCALKSDGEVWCWGDNAQGFLGNGSTTDSAAAVKVNLPEPVDVITGGVAYTCAVGRMGAMWCWGTGDNGGLGNGTVGAKSTPTAVSTRSANWTYTGTAPTTTTTTTTTTTVAPTTTTTPTTTSVAGNVQSATGTATTTTTGVTTTTAPPAGQLSENQTDSALDVSTTEPQNEGALPFAGLDPSARVVLAVALVLIGSLLTARIPNPRG